MMAATVHSVGQQVRDWRRRRRVSQMDLALDAGISTRHLSFVETGRSKPSRDMVLRLAIQLDVPLRERNTMLLAAGFAPAHGDRSLHDRDLAAARATITNLLSLHEPNPALVIDRHWTMLDANRAVAPLLEGVDPALLVAPVNVLRLSLSPGGLASRILNFGEWRAHLLHRLKRQVHATADPILASLAQELSALPFPSSVQASGSELQVGAIAVPMLLATAHGTISLISTTTTFGTPLDALLSEIALETFFPADAASASVLRFMQSSASSRT